MIIMILVILSLLFSNIIYKGGLLSLLIIMVDIVSPPSY